MTVGQSFRNPQIVPEFWLNVFFFQFFFFGFSWTGWFCLIFFSNFPRVSAPNHEFIGKHQNSFTFSKSKLIRFPPKKKHWKWIYLHKIYSHHTKHFLVPAERQWEWSSCTVSRNIISHTLCNPGCSDYLDDVDAAADVDDGTLKSVIQMEMIKLKSVTSYL